MTPPRIQAKLDALHAAQRRGEYATPAELVAQLERIPTRALIRELWHRLRSVIRRRCGDALRRLRSLILKEETPDVCP